jgi:23S rRNA (cytosine1962-C5)-methyltransferase
MNPTTIVNKSVHLKPGREKSLIRRHPWVFSGAIQSVGGDPLPGETVEIYDNQGNFLARGAYSPDSQIRVRVWTWLQGEVVSPDFFQARLSRAFAYREELARFLDTDAIRLVHGESDGLPGLVVDRYGDFLSIQLLSSGAEYWRSHIIDCLAELAQPRGIYERSDVDVRSLEGLTQRTGLVWGEAPGSSLVIHEQGLSFEVDLLHGHKTGFYLDQRQNRAEVARLAVGQRVLDCFCYTGGFSVYALSGGAAQVLAIDSSAQALEIARQNIARNGFEGHQVDWLQGDVFQELRKLRDRGEQFDLVILDPPKFAPTAAQAQRAARGYKDINLLAMKLLTPGGYLATFSCSGGVDSLLFRKIVAGAALDAAVQAQICSRLSQSVDHPVAINFPEGEYLKGLILKIYPE